MPLRIISKIWQSFIENTSNIKILRATLAVGSMTSLVNIASIFKHLVIAQTFGRSDEIDAFLVAYLVPSLLVNIVGGSFNASFIPTYLQIEQEEGKVSSQKLFSNITAWSSIFLLGVVVLTIAAAPIYLKILAIGFKPEKLQLTFRLLVSMSPIIFLSGTLTIWAAVLNTREKFALTALIPVISPLLVTFFLLNIPTIGIYALPIALVVGALLEMLCLGFILIKQDIRLAPKLCRVDSHLKQIASQYVPMIAGAFLLSSTELIDKSMATILGSGSVAAIDYGSRTVALPLSLATIALSTAVTPYFSKMVTAKEWGALTDTIKWYLKIIFFTSVPMVLLLFFYSHEIIELLFQRGAFTEDDTSIVAQVSAYYVIQMPFYIGGIIIVRLISALRYNQILMYSAVISLALNIFLNYIFMKFLGVSGIALSTSVVYIISFCFVFYSAITKIRLFKESSS